MKMYQFDVVSPAGGDYILFLEAPNALAAAREGQRIAHVRPGASIKEMIPTVGSLTTLVSNKVEIPKKYQYR